MQAIITQIERNDSLKFSIGENVVFREVIRKIAGFSMIEETLLVSMTDNSIASIRQINKID